jgi:hypothetical protein
VASVSSLNEIVLFEVPDRTLANRLCELLSSTRLAWVDHGQAVVVGAALGSDPTDLAQLLRGVEAWITAEGLVAIRFEVDGRIYALQRPSAAPTTTAV